MKAKADVIAIAETTSIETVGRMDRFNRSVGINLIKVLKTDVNPPDQDTGQDLQGNVFFSQPDAPDSKDAIVAVSVGGTGNPKPAVGEQVLVFLKRLEGKNAFSVICGSFGYIRLSARSEEELRQVTQSITQHREWSEKIADDQLRKAMANYYRQATAFVEKNKGDVRK